MGTLTFGYFPYQVNFTDPDGRTLLTVAASMGLTRICRVLLGCSPYFGPDTITTTSELLGSDDESQLESLLRPIALLFPDEAVNVADKFGKTALHYAIERKQFRIAELFFSCGRFSAFRDPVSVRFFAEHHYKAVGEMIPRLVCAML